ncbi:MAG TPA: polyhydroxyalkanoic acid system family protein [Pelomicrobium sp.]|nr:polyhydroxyalkanoic acid system family protein [Pelomicrobium sp.]
MSTITIKRSHALSHAKARDAAEAVANKLYEDYGLAYEWQGDSIHFATNGVKGTLHVMPKTVELNAKLGFVLSLLASQIEAEVDKYFGDYFGPAAAAKGKSKAIAKAQAKPKAGPAAKKRKA